MYNVIVNGVTIIHNLSLPAALTFARIHKGYAYRPTTGEVEYP